MKTLVLSGGGVLGFIHLGALQYLNDTQILPDIEKYIGTSIGAIICYLLIIGFSPIEICLYLIQNNSLDRIDHHFNIVNLFYGNGGALSFDPIMAIIREMTLMKRSSIPTLSELYESSQGKQFVICTYNFTKDREELLQASSHPDLDCLVALRMSSNIPILFEPFEYNGDIYFDGMLTNNFPLHAIDPYNDFFIAISLIQNYDRPMFLSEIVVLDLILRILRIPLTNLQNLKNEPFHHRGVVVTIKNNDFTPWRFHLSKSEILDLFSLGYHEVRTFNIDGDFFTSRLSIL